MAEKAFDTLKVAKELERDYGFEAKQAEGAATMFHRHLVGTVATRDDIELVRKDMEALATKDEVALIRNEMATKEEIAKLATKDELKSLATKEEIAHLSADLKWIKVIGSVIVAVIVLPWFKDVALAALN